MIAPGIGVSTLRSMLPSRLTSWRTRAHTPGGRGVRDGVGDGDGVGVTVAVAVAVGDGEGVVVGVGEGVVEL